MFEVGDRIKWVGPAKDKHYGKGVVVIGPLSDPIELVQQHHFLTGDHANYVVQLDTPAKHHGSKGTHSVDDTIFLLGESVLVPEWQVVPRNELSVSTPKGATGPMQFSLFHNDEHIGYWSNEGWVSNSTHYRFYPTPNLGTMLTVERTT